MNNKLILFVFAFILLTSSVYAYTQSNNIPVTPNTNTASALGRGQQIMITNDTCILNVSRVSGADSDRLYVYNRTNSLLKTVDIDASGNWVLNILGVKNMAYKLTANKSSGASVTHRFVLVGGSPYNQSSNELNWTMGLYNNLLEDDTTYNEFSTIITGTCPTGVNVTLTSPTNASFVNGAVNFSGRSTTGTITPGNITNVSLYVFNQSYMSLINDSSLVAYYKLDGNANDETGRNNGTLVNSPTSTEGKVGGAYNLLVNNIVNQTINENNFNVTNVSSLTLSMWTKLSSGTATTDYSIRAKGGAFGFGHSATTGASFPQFRLSNLTFVSTSTTGMTQGVWTYLTAVYNGTYLLFYKDASLVASSRISNTQVNLGGSAVLGIAFGNGTFDLNSNYNGTLDEVMIFNRSLSANEIYTLYNQSQSRYVQDLNSSVDKDFSTIISGFTQNAIKFYWSAYQSFINQSNAYSGIMSSLFTFTVDSVNPIISIAYPSNNSEIITTFATRNISLNYTITETNLGSCWYTMDNGVTNISISCNTNTTINLTAGDKNFRVYVNDSAGNSAYSQTSFLINYINVSMNYTSSVTEGINQTYWINFTANNFSNVTGTITINNTLYNLTTYSSNATQSNLYAYAVAPVVTTTTLINVYANLTINGQSYNIPINKQQVVDLPNITVSICANPSYTFSLFDEGNLTSLNGTFNYNFKYGLYNNSIELQSYGTITNYHTFMICTNQTISSEWRLGEGQIFYTSTNYEDRRYYTFANISLNTTNVNISLHSLLSSDQTSFQLTAEDSSLNVYDSFFATLVRWYPNLNEYRVVDVGLTDETGSTVIHVKSEDVDYRIGIYHQNGTLVYLANPIRMTCILSPCTYTLRVPDETTDYTNILGITKSLIYNSTSGMWTFTYSDSSLRTTSMNLTIWKDTPTTSYPICTSTTTGYIGAVTCNTSGYTGTLRGEAYRSASPAIRLDQKIVSSFTTSFKSQYGLWLTMLIAIPIIFILAVISPVAGVVGGMIALIPAYFLGSINLGILGGIVVLGGIIIHFFKRVS